jgi:hypothetical protein
MMDFDLAASRLLKDQQSAAARSKAQRAARAASAKAKRDAASSRAAAEKRLQAKKLEVEKKSRVKSRVLREVERVERRLGVVNVGAAKNKDHPTAAAAATAHTGSTVELLFEEYNSPLGSGWRLNPTSIHGEGDKIALPPSILQELTSSQSDGGLDPWTGQGGNRSRPLAFRIGVLNPGYSGFPSSDKMKRLVEEVNKDITVENQRGESTVSKESNDTIDQDIELDSDEEDEAEVSSWREAYLDELSHRYISYTHGTVVEFTQEDECVGLPEPIANALLFPNAYSLIGNSNAIGAIETKRTRDPAATTTSEKTGDESDSNDDEMEIEKTPGHPAYGAFDLPDTKIEIIPIKHLPPGKQCTFTPTPSSIHNGFYGLKDIKLVLEQSLIRTRATLSKGDVVRTWRRGVAFDLIVSKLAPADYGVVSCVNTDLNVDIGPPAEEGMTEKESGSVDDGKNAENEQTLNDGARGRTLAEESSIASDVHDATTNALNSNQIELIPEPPENETSGVCVVQIRGGRGSNLNSGRRRFRISTATMKDLFAFASSIVSAGDGHYKLVTRFPRKVFVLSASGGEDCYRPEDTLESAGITEGQVLFMIEHI